MGGPDMAPQTPQCSARPGEAVTRLDHALLEWARTWPPKPPNVRHVPAKPLRASITPYSKGPRHGRPNPPTLGTSRHSRDAPRSRVTRMGPDMAAQPPPTLGTARRSRGGPR